MSSSKVSSGSAEAKHEIGISTQEQSHSPALPAAEEVELGRLPKPSFAHCKTCECQQCEGKEMEYEDADDRKRLEGYIARSFLLRASPAASSNRKLLATSPSLLPTPRKLKDRLFHKRQRSPSSSPSPSPNVVRKGNRTPSASSTNASNSACIVDEDDSNTRCFCAFPICMNFLDDAAKMIRRTMENENPGVEQQRLGHATAKLSLVGSASGASLRSRKENLPPNVMQLLKASDFELFSSAEDDYNEADAAPNFLRLDKKPLENGETSTVNSPANQQSIFRASRFSNVPPTIRYQISESTIMFARDERLGWLTFCPTNLGNTIRASVHIKFRVAWTRPRATRFSRSSCCKSAAFMAKIPRSISMVSATRRTKSALV